MSFWGGLGGFFVDSVFLCVLVPYRDIEYNVGIKNQESEDSIRDTGIGSRWLVDSLFYYLGLSM